MSWPACMWPGRDSPKVPVTVPLTGVAIRPLPQPPLAIGAATGVVDSGLAGAAWFDAGAVEGAGKEEDGEVLAGAGRVVVRGEEVDGEPPLGAVDGESAGAAGLGAVDGESASVAAL